MELWDRDVDERAEAAVSALVEGQLFSIAMDVIERTVPIFDPPFPEFFPPVARVLIESTIRQCRSVLPDGRLSEPEVERYFEVQEQIDSIATRPGVGPYLVAIGRVVESLGSGSIDADEVLEVMSSCYESIVMSNITGRESIEKELASPPCVAAIGMQLELVDSYQE